MARSSQVDRPVTACCWRVRDSSAALGGVRLECQRCHTVTCGLHAYIGVRGEWRCAGCFQEVAAPGRPMTLRLPGQIPPPPEGTAHVVVVVHGLHICGAARHCLELLSALNESGVHTSVVALQGGGHWGDRFLANTNDVTIFSSPSTDGRELVEIPWRAPRRIISAHYDPAVSWAVASPVSAEIFAHFHTEPEFGMFTRATLLVAGPRCRAVFFPSVTTQDSYRTLLHGQVPAWWEATCQVLPNAVPVSVDATPAPPRNRDADEPVNLAVVSRIDPEKMSISLLVDTVEALKRQLPRLRVRVAGGGVVSAQLEHALAQRCLDKCVELLGWVDDVAPVYAWSHATFLPSHSETMPYAAIESVRCGRPVALPALGYFSEAGAEETLIQRFTPGDPSSAVRALRRALAESGRGREAPAVTGGRFDPARWRRGVLARYDLTGEAEGASFD